jgi:hypothetical protein
MKRNGTTSFLFVEFAQTHSMSSESKKWLQYIKFHKWAHENCTKLSDFYVRRNCNSDNNTDDSTFEDWFDV